MEVISIPRQDLLVSTEWLAEHLDDPNIRIVDVRWGLDDDNAGEEAYKKSHIPGAVYLHWYRDLSDSDHPVNGMLAPPEKFRQTMERAGISDDTLVVAYDDNVIFMAARLLWCLHCYGHDRVRILNGGFNRWVAEGRPLTSEIPQPPRGQFTPRPRPELRLTKEDMLKNLETGERQVFDCRMDETWIECGEHIPGASRLPSPRFLNEQGLWKDVEELEQLCREAGVSRTKPKALYCGGGVSASAAYVALLMQGLNNVAVYDGSWSEWGNDPNTPKERHG